MALPLPEPEHPLQDLRLAVVDLETTGGRPRGGWDREGRFRPAAEVTEVGLVRMSGRILEASYTTLCAIEGTIPPVIQRLTGLSSAQLTDAPPWEQVALRLAEEMEGRTWVAHHAPFDGSFLKAYLPEGLWRRHTLICTVKLARALVPEVRSRSLGALCEVLGLSNRRPHRALPDAEATAELMQVLLDRAEARGLDAAAFLDLGRIGWEKL